MSLTMLTPCWAGDLARLALLRESADALGVTMEHVAVVHTEDLSEARSVLPRSTRLQLVATSEVLTPELERARVRGRHRWVRGLPWNRSGRALSGWWTQQLVKLGAGRALGLEAWLCVDADSAFIAPFAEDDVRSGDGRLDLQEWNGVGVSAAVRARHVDAARALDLDPARLDPARTYVGWPVPLHGGVTERLLTLLEHDGVDWQRAFVAGGLTEYPLYGLYARHRDPAADVVPVDRRLALALYAYDPATLPEQLGEAVRAGRRMVMVHSRLGVDADDYAAALRAHWRDAGRS